MKDSFYLKQKIKLQDGNSIEKDNKVNLLSCDNEWCKVQFLDTSMNIKRIFWVKNSMLKK